jgi:hypothetical protein
MSEREVSNLAGYAFLASTALAIIRRLQLQDANPQAHVRPFTRSDASRLEQLRQLLDASWRGAQLYGAAPNRGLTGMNHEPTVHQRVESFDLVHQLVPNNESFVEFVERSNNVLRTLEGGEWRIVATVPQDVDFVEAELTPFLKQLAHASEMVLPAGRRSKAHASTLV